MVVFIRRHLAYSSRLKMSHDFTLPHLTSFAPLYPTICDDDGILIDSLLVTGLQIHVW